MNEPPQKKTTHQVKQSSRLRKVLRWLVILGSVLFLLLVSAGLLLTYWFPSERVKQELEVRLSSMLQGTVRIESLSFNLLTGLELEQVHVVQNAKPLLSLKRLNLDYSLIGLLQQQLTINEVLIDRANVFLNVPELSPPAEPSEAPPPPAEPSSLPPIPVSLDVRALMINHSNIRLILSPTLTVSLTDLNVHFSGGATAQDAQLAGSLNVSDLTVDLDKKTVQLPLDLTLALSANLQEERFHLTQFTLQSDPSFQLTLAGQVNRFLTKKEMDLSLRDVRIDLKKILALAKDFIPPDLAENPISGILSPKGHIKGALAETGFGGTVDVTLEAQKLQADLPGMAISLGPTDFSIQGSDLKIKDNMPEFGNLHVTMSNQGVSYQNYAVRDLNLDVSSEYFAAGPVKGRVTVSGVSTLPPLGPVHSLTLPFQVHLDAKGNYRQMDMTLKKLAVNLGTYLNLQAHGKVHPHPQPSQAIDLSLTTRIEPFIGNILPLVPKEWLKGITVKKGDGADLITLDVTSTVNASYLPQQAKVSSRIKLSSLTTSLDTLPAGGALDRMNLLVAAGYDARSGSIQATIGTALKLLDLHQGGALSIGQIGLTLKSTVNGTISPAFKLTGLQSKDGLALNVSDLSYRGESVQAAIDGISLLSKTKEDVLSQEYVIEAFRLSSDSLFNVKVKGRYGLKDQQFTLAVDMPSFHVGEVLKRLSGTLVEGLNEMKPQGRIVFSLQASGRVPQAKDMKQLAIPIEAAAKVNLENVEGTFTQHHITGAGGTLAMSFVPGDHPVAQVTSDLHVDDVQLAPGLPLKHISHAFAKVNVTSRNFDEIQFDQLHLGVNGGEVTVHGTVAGFKEFLVGEPSLGPLMGKLFAQVGTTISVDLDAFQDMLVPAGLEGSGHTQVEFSLLKNEEGPLDVGLHVAGRSMNLHQNGTQVTNLEGGLAIRKHLVWSADSQKPRTAAHFTPTDVLSQLRQVNGKRSHLTIDKVVSGGLTLSNVSLDLLFDGHAFKIQNLAVNLLSGGLGGNIVLRAGKAFGATAQLEAARLNLNDLLEDKLKIAGDSLIDATIGLSVFFEEQTGALDVSRTAVNLHVTHIGREALDRILVFLDPEGSNPTFVGIRSQIKLANPSRVTINIARGMMDLEILFSEGLLSSFKMDRIPVGSIKNLQNVTQGIPNWNMVINAMEMAGANSYGLDEKGNIQLQ